MPPTIGSIKQSNTPYWFKKKQCNTHTPGDTTLSEPGDSRVVSLRLARITTIGLQLALEEEEEEEEEILHAEH